MSFNISKFLFFLSVGIFVTTIALGLVLDNSDFSPFLIGDPDRYINNFNDFVNKGILKAHIEGTSILFNLVVSIPYFFVKDVSFSIFFINLLSQLFLLFFGIYIIRKNSNELRLEYKILIYSVYMFSIIGLNSFSKGANDTFQAVFFLLVFNIIFKVIRIRRDFEFKELLLISFYWALCTLIRPTSLIFILFISFFIFIYSYSIQAKIILTIKTTLKYVVPVFAMVVILHSPSIYYHKRLSFYDKNFEKNMNWTQRNYLALKLMEKKELPISKNSIFREVPFSKVKEFLEVNGKESLPDNQLNFIVKDPMLYLKLIVFNVIYSLLNFFRYYSILIFLPFLYSIYKRDFKLVDNLYKLLFLLIVVLISATCFTLIEFRWFTGYSILVSFVIIDFLRNVKKDKWVINTISLILLNISIFNFYLTFFSSKNY